jgi:hypothetical protein
MSHIKTDQQLAYFVQGFFEIGEDQAVLTDATAKKLVHIILNMDEKGETATLILDALKVSPELDITANLDGASAKIKQGLHDIFVHVIDPNIEGDQKALLEVHSGSDQTTSTSRKPEMGSRLC